MAQDHNLRVYDSVLGLLSNEDNPTPLVQLQKVVPFTQAKVYAKLEWYNPFGAVKDRIAANLVADAEERGDLSAGKKLVEPTSGNTGLGLSMVSNAKGYPLKATLSKAIPLEKRAILRFFGTDVMELDDDLCPAPGAAEGAIHEATTTAEENSDFHMLNQYGNEANPQAHLLTTGPEIWKQTQGKVTHFVAALGTCGTITGVGKYLKEQNPNVQIIGVHPEDGHDIPGVRSVRQLSQTRFFQPENYDHLVEVSNREAYDLCLRLNQEESLIAGPSSGLALAGLLKVLADAPDAVVVVIFPDNIFKYASSVQRHFPEMFKGIAGAASAVAEPTAREKRLAHLVDISRNPLNTLELEEALKLNEAGDAVFVDVRGSEAYQSAHVEGALNIPFADLSTDHQDLPKNHDQPIVTVCNRGTLSISGMLALKALGFSDVRSLNGGTTGWLEKGYPAKKS